MRFSDRISKGNSVKIILSNITSRLGNSVFDYANQMIISHIFPNTPFYLGIYQSAEQIVGIIFNLFAGAFADKHDRKKMLIYTDLLSGIVCIFALLFVSSKLLYIALITGNVLLAVLHSYNSPLYNSMVKESISESYIEKHMSIFTTWKELIKVIAPVVGLCVYKLFGIQLAYLFNAITFFCSAFISKGIQRIDNSENQKGCSSNKESVFLQIKDGVVYIYNNKTVRNLLVVSTCVNFFLSSYNILLPYLTQYYENRLSNFFGLALIFQSIGAILFSLLNTRYSNKLSLNSHSKMLWSLFMLGISISIIPVIDSYFFLYFNLVPYFCIGGFLTIFNIQFFSLVQKETDTEYIGRVYSVIFTISIFFMPVGNVFFGSFLSVSNLQGMSISGIGVVLSILFYIAANKFQMK